MNKVDWSKAPDGSEFYANGRFRKKNHDGKCPKRFDEGEWISGSLSYIECLNSLDYEIRPDHIVDTNEKAWPESEDRVDIIGTNGNDGQHYSEVKPASAILQEGLSILSERGKQYGSEGEERSFPQVAQAFTALTGKQLVGSDVCLILALIKQVRQYAQPRYHHDSAVDGVNYLALQAEELQKERTNGL